MSDNKSGELVSLDGTIGIDIMCICCKKPTGKTINYLKKLGATQFDCKNCGEVRVYCIKNNTSVVYVQPQETTQPDKNIIDRIEL